MNKISFAKPWFKWALIFGILVLMAFNIQALGNSKYLASVWIIFQVFLLILICTRHKWTKSVLEGISLLYAILNGFNLILMVIPLFLQLVKPIDDFDNGLYLDLFLTSIKLACAILTYQFSKKYIVSNQAKSS